jgi:Coenzyme PQQ synthesis protein D (PqqD)
MFSQESQIEDNSLLHCSFQTADNVLFRQVEDEAILLYVPSGTYFGLNSTGILLWQAIQNKQSLLSIVDTILAEYEVERLQVIDDLQALLQNLLDNELVIKIE